MKFASRLLGLLLTLTLLSAGIQAQTKRSADDPRNPAPTVNGGTGLFTVYDAQTLRKGEFNISIFANHFHRDPGDLAIQQYPFNFTLGLSDHLEFFASFGAQEVITAGNPARLSGFYLPDVQTKTLAPGRIVIVPYGNGRGGISSLIGDPCGNGGFAGPCLPPAGSGIANIGPFIAVPSANRTAVYPGLGAPVGGILPAIATANAINPGYYPNAPFLARFSDNHLGDLWFGGKIRFTGPNNPFGFALIPVLKVPLSRTLSTGLQRGRGTGAFDYGVIAAIDGRLHKYVNLSSNIGFVKKGDPRAQDMNLGPLCVGCNVIQGFGTSDRALDLPNELRTGIAFDFPVSRYLQFIAELRGTHYVSGKTPALDYNNPIDLLAGARIFPTRWMSVSLSYQRHLNWMSNLARLNGPNGFLAGFSIGRVNDRKDPVLPNQPPTVTLAVGAVQQGSTDVIRASASTVCRGDKVALQASASDPDGDTLLYSWNTTGGKIIGDGANVVFDTTGLAPGEYTITSTVDDGCGCVAFDSKTIRVEECPPATLCFDPNTSLTADKSSVEVGEAINLTTSGVSGGRNYGDVRYEWSTSAGTITGNGQSARLDTSSINVEPGQSVTVEVTVKAVSAVANCSASGSTRLTVSKPMPPKKPEASALTPCTTFKKNNARVDNACKAILQTTIIPAMQADPQATLIIEGYRSAGEKPEGLSLQRAKNLRDRLADGGLGNAIDANRITVRDGGVSETEQSKVWLVPAGADVPAGGSAVDAGPVEPEKKASARGKKRR